MKILMLHNRYDIRGGEDESTDAECELLRAIGHEVDLLEADNSVIGNQLSLMATARATLWNWDWYSRVDKRLRSACYDVVHVQNFFPLISPAVYYAAEKNGVPVVQAVRNYRLICPAASLFRDGHYCDDCVTKLIKWPAVQHACYRGSKAGSTVLAAMVGLHKAAGTWRSKVDTYVAISEFVRERMIEGGFPPGRIVVKPNFAKPRASGFDSSLPCAKDHLLYVGRITREKGADLLLDAYQRSGSALPLKIIGAGDLEVPAAIAGRVVLAGRRPLDQVYAAMREALCVVMPGAWPEPFGRVAVEAFANGTSVIASDIAGCREIVEPGRTGALFPAGDVARLATLLGRVSEERAAYVSMGRAAEQVWRERYSPEANVSFFNRIYANLGASAKAA